jgi:hypothetical protein
MRVFQHLSVKVWVIAGALADFEIIPHTINSLLTLPSLIRCPNLCGFLGLRIGYPAAAVEFGVVNFSRFNI